MKTLPIILLITGVLTIIIGSLCFRESRLQQGDFDHNLDELRGDPKNRMNIITFYNNKCNALSLYGILSIAYGIIVSAIATYMLVPDHNKKHFILFTGIVIVVGIALIIAAMTIKDLYHPNPAKK